MDLNLYVPNSDIELYCKLLEEKYNEYRDFCIIKIAKELLTKLTEVNNTIDSLIEI